MRARMMALAGAISMSCGAALAQAAGDEAGVRALIAGLTDAWDAGSAAAWTAHFSPDAEMILPRGLRIIGQDAIADGHAGVFATIYQDTTLDISVDHIRFLSPDVALVAFEQIIVPAPGTTPQGSAGQTLISTMIARQVLHEDGNQVSGQVADQDGDGVAEQAQRESVWRVEYMDAIPAAPADFELPTADNPSSNGE